MANATTETHPEIGAGTSFWASAYSAPRRDDRRDENYPKHTCQCPSKVSFHREGGWMVCARKACGGRICS